MSGLSRDTLVRWYINYVLSVKSVLIILETSLLSSTFCFHFAWFIMFCNEHNHCFLFSSFSVVVSITDIFCNISYLLVLGIFRALKIFHEHCQVYLQILSFWSCKSDNKSTSFGRTCFMRCFIFCPSLQHYNRIFRF